MSDPMPETPETQENTNEYPQPLVSVVMPIRNQERVLRETLECVCSQSLRNFELICVDDGSTDSSVEIEREFANRDYRLRLFLRDTEGAAPARNYGLSQAAGRYVIFLDSDDLFHPDMLLDMASVLEATGADICICEADVFTDGNENDTTPYSTLLAQYEEGLYRRSEFGRNTFQLGGRIPWNKMYRHEFLKDIGVRFQNTKCCNDCFFVAKAMWEASSVYLLKKTLVSYREGLGTSIQDRRLDHSDDIIRVAEAIFDGVDEIDAFSESEAASLRHLCTSLLMTAVNDMFFTGSYNESIHKHVVADLQRWSSPGAPYAFKELKYMMQATLIKHATYDKATWAHERWRLKQHDHTLLDEADFVTRIVVALTSSGFANKQLDDVLSDRGLA